MRRQKQGKGRFNCQTHQHAATDTAETATAKTATAETSHGETVTAIATDQIPRGAAMSRKAEGVIVIARSEQQASADHVLAAIARWRLLIQT